MSKPALSDEDFDAIAAETDFKRETVFGVMFGGGQLTAVAICAIFSMAAGPLFLAGLCYGLKSRGVITLATLTWLLPTLCVVYIQGLLVFICVAELSRRTWGSGIGGTRSIVKSRVTKKAD